MNSEIERKTEEIKRILDKDLLAADVKVSIFGSAAISFKQDSLLSPFPKHYIGKEGTKDFDKLVEDLDKIPELEEFLVLLMSENASFLSEPAIELLHYILTSPKFYTESVPKTSYNDVLALCKKSGSAVVKPSSKPTHIFKVNYVDSGAENRFQQLTLGNDTKYAFHGTRWYNMFSILNYGLNQHLNKTGLFGEGLYFAQELDVSLLFSPSVLGWNKSNIGNVVSCVAVCEYIDDPAFVKVRKENAKNSDIPQSYLLITNNELVRVRYLLMYGSKKKSTVTKKPSTEEVEVAPRSALKWCRKNPLIVSVVLYVVLLFLVGLSNHRAVEYYKNNLWEFLKKRFKFL